MSEDFIQRVLHELHRMLAYQPRQVKLFIQALTHSSHANEHQTESNERLEFLGDAVLELAVSHALYSRFPHAQEGHLTKMRSALVSEAALAEAARTIGLHEWILLGRGEEAQGGREKNSVVSDALEALLGALFLDGGLQPACALVDHLFAGKWPTPPETFRPADFKSKLQEYTQSRWRQRPTYSLLASRGPEHAKEYHVQVTVPDGQSFCAWETSIRKAEQAAAAAALQALTESDAHAESLLKPGS
jgi:ribonuclease-3